MSCTDTGTSGSVMTPAACDAAIFNSRRNSDAQDHVLLSGLSIPVPAGLCCTMDFSDLLAALTTPLLSGTSSASSSLNSSDGDCTGTKNVTDMDRSGGSNRSLSEEQCGKVADAAEGPANGCWKPQGSQQRHQNLGQPLWRPSSYFETKFDAGEDCQTYLISKDKDAQKDFEETVDVTFTTQATPSVSDATGTPAAGGVTALPSVANGQITQNSLFITAEEAASSTAASSLVSQVGLDVFRLHRESAGIQRESHKPRAGKAGQEETVCKVLRETDTDAGHGSRHDSPDIALQTACCSRGQQPPLLSSRSETHIVKEDGRATVKVETEKAGRTSDSGIPCEANQMGAEKDVDYHDRSSALQNEHKLQQHRSSSLLTSNTSPKRVHLGIQQQQQPEDKARTVTEESQGAGWQAKQQGQQQKRKQTDDNDEGDELPRGIAQEHEGMKEGGGGVRASDAERSREKVTEEDQCGVGTLTPTSVQIENLENACDASRALQQRKQLLLEELEHLQKGDYDSEESTGSPSKRTSFEDAAVESTVAGGKERKNCAYSSHGMQWQKAQEKKQQRAQGCLSKNHEGEGLSDDELKKSVSAVLAVAFRGKAGREVKSEKDASYPFSAASSESGPDGFTASSFETAASSQSQSPLNVQKEEAVEGARCGSTNDTGHLPNTCSAINDNSHQVSDTPELTQDKKSSAPDTSHVYLPSPKTSSALCESLPRRGSFSRFTRAATDENKLGTTDGSTPGSDSQSTGNNSESVCHHNSSSWNHSAEGGGDNSLSNNGTPFRGNGIFGANAAECNPAAVAYDTCSVSRNSMSSPSGEHTSPVKNRSDGLRGGSASGKSNTINSCAVVACMSGSLSKDNGALLEHRGAPQGSLGSSRRPGGVNWTSATVAAAVMEDCLHSVRDLEQNAARVLLVPPASTGGANIQQILLPSLLLQNTPLGSDEGRFTKRSVWGGKREKVDTLAAARAADAFLSSASSVLGFYQSALYEAPAVGVRKNSTGMMLLPPPLSDGILGSTATSAGPSALLQPQLTSDVFPHGGGGVGQSPLLGSGPLLPAAHLCTPGAVNSDTPASTLAQTLPQILMLQQGTGNLNAPSLPSTVPSSLQPPPTLPAPFPPWTTSVATPTNIGAVASVARTPTATAVAAAALLPRSFRSRSDYLSLCSLQGCSATQENVRKPRSLNELRQLPSEEYISLPEMHLLAESLVSDFMKLQHGSSDLSSSSRGTTTRVRRQGAAQKITKEEPESDIPAKTSAATTTPPKSELLVLHYRRDNLSFSVTPASSFTPFPPFVFEGAKKKTHSRNGCGSRVGLAVCDNLDELEEEKKETLLGSKCLTSSDLHTNTSCPFAPSDRAASRRDTGARGHVRTNSAVDGGRALTARGANADDFFPPHATTHLFRARCQQAGTETGISDSTIGAVNRAFTEATTSFFRELERQSNRCASFCSREASVDEYAGKQQRTSTSGKGTVEEPRSNGGKADVKGHSTRSGGTASRNCQRPVPINTTSGAAWRQARVN